jgi:hypothetical protein
VKAPVILTSLHKGFQQESATIVSIDVTEEMDCSFLAIEYDANVRETLDA